MADLCPDCKRPLATTAHEQAVAGYCWNESECLRAQLASALQRAEAAELERASLLAFCRSRIAQCADMDAQGVPHPGSFREGRVAAFLAVIAILDSASPVKP